jgi:prepilin-type N-terminal cleavage/methylation domain-containing protein
MLALLKRNRKQGGFTLLELLMVVIIIAILASIALPQYIRATEKARASEALQLLGAIRASENRYRAQSSTAVYTGLIGDLDAELPATSTAWGSPPVATFGAAGPGGPKTVSFTRAAGTFIGTKVGINFDTGVLCGTFPPLFAAAVPCP